MTKSKYYNIDDDMQLYPDCWAYIIIGGRNTGKTYGALKSCTTHKRKHCFTKRTNDDVKLLCSGNGKIGSKISEFGVDLSPYKSINRDLKTNIKAFQIDKGLGAFWNADDENQPYGDPIGYLLSLNAVQKFKGFDLSDCDWLIIDEFIPQPWERYSKKEGEQIMDLYKTIARDRELRGRPPLKLVALANATTASNPLCNILEITDLIVQMELKNEEYCYLEERGILIHRVVSSKEFTDAEQKSKFYAAMADTDWGHMAWDNKFAYNDFSSVTRVNLKNYKPLVSVIYKHKQWYVYYNDKGEYYMCKSHCNVGVLNLNIENDQKKFFLDYVSALRMATIEGKMKFQDFTMYDIIMNYKKYFEL